MAWSHYKWDRQLIDIVHVKLISIKLAPMFGDVKFVLFCCIPLNLYIYTLVKRSIYMNV